MPRVTLNQQRVAITRKVFGVSNRNWLGPQSVERGPSLIESSALFAHFLGLPLAEPASADLFVVLSEDDTSVGLELGLEADINLRKSDADGGSPVEITYSR